MEVIINFQELGLKVGIEIHQQILTRQKLFCRCPAGLYTTEHDAEVLRHMRPTLSEMGTYDGTALMEFKTKKEIIYLLNRKNVCTYEMDDTPPFIVNQEALENAIEIALAFGCNIIDELHISRKQYLDGSIPTGFQRTTVVGIEGSVPYKDRSIRIQQVNLEEDACREVSDLGHTITFNTDRLGMPLVEIITYPDIRTPEEAGEVIALLGQVMRSTRKVRRGLGSVRQDVNVSIEGGTRVEIKGVPKIGYVPKLVAHEAMRQKHLLEMRDELRSRGLRSQAIANTQYNLTPVIASGAIRLFADRVQAGARVGAIKLAHLAGIFRQPIQPGRTFADDIIGRVRVIACLDQAPILVHTDDFPTFPGSDGDLQTLKAITELQSQDLLAICAGPAADVATALTEILIRVEEACVGIPNETRQRLNSGSTDFERILPGPDRMYPDTDHPSVKIPPERIERIRARLPEPVWEREQRYRALGLAPDLARELVTHRLNHIFDSLAQQDGLRAQWLAVALMQILKHLRRRGHPVDQIPDAELTRILTSVPPNHKKELIDRILQQCKGRRDSDEAKTARR